MYELLTFRSASHRVLSRRSYSSSLSAPRVDSKWLSQTTARIGKCITFGLKGDQISEAGAVCQELAGSWRGLLAGGEGYLTGIGRRGLWKYQVNWGEMDSMGHVNNVRYVRYAESARVNWAANYANHVDTANKTAWQDLWSPRGTGMILRSIKVDYKFPMTYPDRVTVFHKLASLPQSQDDSFKLDVIMLSERHRRPVARCVEDIVMYDYRAGSKVKMESTPFVLDAFQDTFRLQEEAAEMNRKQADSISRRVRDLEQASWDRDDAVEDFGSEKS